MIRKLIRAGATLHHPRWLNRNIKVTNEIALLCLALVIVLAIVHAFTHPGENLTTMLLMAAGFAGVVGLNACRSHAAARTLLTLDLLAGTLALSVMRKVLSPAAVTEITFMQPRVALIVFSVLPFAYFHFRERRLLIVNLAIGFATVALFDPINNALGVGFYHFGFANPDYYYHNVFTLVIYFILVGAVGLFKHTIDSYEARNENLIDALHRKNELVQDQRQQLESQSQLLKQLLDERDQDLYSVTQEIMRFNIELQQYSYTLSHNLRGPVASLQGLLELLDQQATPEDREYIVRQFQAPVTNLDTTIRALNSIVAVQHDTFNIREKINIADEVKVVLDSLKDVREKYDVRISLHLAATEILASRQRIHFILMCLFRNAIQYRRPEVAPEIVFKTLRHEAGIIFEITDNGSGIDLDRYRDQLFKPFKIFHRQASGRGLSLYFLKLHLEKLQGKVEVKSTPGKGTTFTLLVKDWEE